MSPDGTIISKVQKVISDEIRPQIQMDGGDIRFVKLENGVVSVALEGACTGCAMSSITLKMGVETYMKKKFPDVVHEVRMV